MQYKRTTPTGEQIVEIVLTNTEQGMKFATVEFIPGYGLKWENAEYFPTLRKAHAHTQDEGYMETVREFVRYEGFHTVRVIRNGCSRGGYTDFHCHLTFQSGNFQWDGNLPGEWHPSTVNPAAHTL